nr:DNA/RNA nuclease SfsA [uncultured Acetobacterium sp.]
MKKQAIFFEFDTELVEAKITGRKSQFVIDVVTEDGIIPCHCPTTGRIGNIELTDRPCLLSKSQSTKRKTPYTVEAISLNKFEDKNKVWIGINQNAVNRYVEFFLNAGGFAAMVGTDNRVLREQVLGLSKLDFLVGNTYLEVKTPLQSLQITIPDYVKTKKTTPFSSTDRFVKHMTELGNSLQNAQRAILLICFIYDNPGFKVIDKSTNSEHVKAAVDKSVALGVEMWQANFEIQPDGVRLDKYFRHVV